MNTKLLKQKILDLAIRGKLTQQLKSDGNTADLLKEISSACHPERSAKGAKSKDLKQIIPLDKNEAPFEIPANWEWVRLGDVCDISSAKRVLKEDWKDSGIPFYRAREIAQLANGEKVKDDLFITKELYESLKRQYGVPQPGDILMSAVGTIGKTYIVQKNDCFYYKDASVICLKIRSLNISPTFLKILLASDFLQKQMYANSSGTTVDTITISVAQEYFFPLPPFAEQQRIVAKIEEAFAEIDAIEKNKELLKTHIKQTRQKILDLAIHGKLVPQNKSDEPASVLLERITRDNPHYEKIEDEPFEIPENWTWCKLGDVLNIARGGSPRPIQDYLTDDENGLNWIKIGDAEKGGKYIETVKEKIKPSGLSHTRAVKAGDFLLTNSMSFGRPYILKVDGCIHDGWLVLGNVKKSMIPDFLYFMLSSDFIYQSFAFAAAGSTVKNLKSETVQGTLFPLPPLAEQSRIVAKIEELFSTLDQMERNLV